MRFLIAGRAERELHLESPALFLGIVLYLMETPGKLVTIGQVLRETLADGDGSKYFANIIAMLCQPLSRDINGAAITIDGGTSA